MAYSTTEDLLLGDIPVPTDAGKYIDDAADEIDSKLGLRYQTPIMVSDSPETRVTNLILKRINNWLASGRLIVAKAASGEIQYQHAYGRQLITDAEAALNQIASGDMILPGAAFINADDKGVSGPIIANVDAASGVEAFYGLVTTDPCTQITVPVLFPPGTNRRTPYTW